MVFRLVNTTLTTAVLLQFLCHIMFMTGCGMRDVSDVGPSGCGMFGMLDVEMWDVRGVGYLGCGIFRIFMECSGCQMFRMWDVRDVGCSRYGVFRMWDVGVCCIRDVVLQHANCLPWSGSYRLYLPLKFLLILTNGFTHTYSKRQKSISFYKYLIFRLNWIARQFLLFLFYTLNNN